ncbi:MAG: VWA domain-containing protein [Clostridiales bacterium]|nr:VWA domain-containing protein [Clostridiales bacterium]
MSQNNWGNNSGFGNTSSNSFGSSGSFGTSGSSDGFGSGSGFSSFGGFSDPSNGSAASNGAAFGNSSWDGGDQYTPVKKNGGWCVALTLASLLCAGLAFLLAYLTRNTFRNVPLFGIVFAAPAILLMFLVLGIESSFSPMNPRYSRKYQTIIAACIAGIYLISGCLGEFIHEYAGVSGNKANVIILLDKSGSMTDSPFLSSSTYDDLCVDALETVLNNVPGTTNVGFIAFDSDILSSISLKPYSQNRLDIKSQMRMPPVGGTNFEKPLTAALNMIQNTSLPTKILLITDGEGSLGSDSTKQWFETTCRNKNASIYYVYINQPQPYTELQQLVTKTNGKSVSVNDPTSILGTLQDLNLFVAEDDLFHTNPKPRRDLIINGFVQIIPAIALGIGLFLMLSRQGQKRFQLILSPLMGIAAYIVLNYTNLSPEFAEALAQSLPLLVFMRKNA